MPRSARSASIADDAAELRPLHGGRHSLPPEVVAFNQRERILAAMAQTIDEEGYNEVTVAKVSKAASVSRRTFYELFADKEDCFVAAYEAIDSYLKELLTEAVVARKEWSDQVATLFVGLIRFFAAHPDLARLYWVESTVVGQAMQSHRERGARRLIDLLAAGRTEREDERPLPEGMDEALVGGVMTLIGRHVRAGEAAQLERYTPAVIEFVLSPYLGSERARGVAASAESAA